MKSSVIAASAVTLFVIASVAHSQSTPQASQPVQEEKNAAQAPDPGVGTEDYGGTPSTQTQGDVKHARPCRIDPQCNVFFGGS